MTSNHDTSGFPRRTPHDGSEPTSGLNPATGENSYRDSNPQLSPFASEHFDPSVSGQPADGAQPLNPYAAPAESAMQMPPPIVPATASVRLATRTSRFVANLIDNVLASLVVIPAFAVVLFAFGGLYPEDEMSFIGEEILISVVSFPLLVVATLLLNGFLLATRGQTIGKYFLSIQVVDYNSGQILPLSSIMLKRYVPIWIIQFLPFVGRIGALIDACLIFGEEQRCGHDYIANTKVIVYQSSAARA